MATVAIYYDGDEIRAKLIERESAEDFDKNEHGLGDNAIIAVIDGVDSSDYTVYIDGEPAIYSGES